MAHDLSGKTVAFLVANEGIEQVELTKPWKAVEQARGRPVLMAGAGSAAYRDRSSRPIGAEPRPPPVTRLVRT